MDIGFYYLNILLLIYMNILRIVNYSLLFQLIKNNRFCWSHSLQGTTFVAFPFFSTESGSL